ncbi:hypothetical protein ATJ97_2573 [Georgenia soli]|uniref:Lanthionine synthetase-like protein n=2 Tax=Georgenia soli TaxID=638953 RepID=A0A2A9EMM5_9MICO|nr:hypothetical protein ATJ97_2573 [Georgenia soli]
MLLPFELRTAAHAMAAVRPAREALGGAVPAGVLVDMAARGAVDLSALESADYSRLLEEVGQAILATATPERTDRLFPDNVALMAGGAGGAAGQVSFGHGATGVLWALAEAGVEVPDELVDWLVRAVENSDGLGPGLFDGASGIALALDRLGRAEAAARLWGQVEQVPLVELGTGLADGLPGVGLALLERAPVRDVDALLARATAIGAELLDRLAVEDPWPGGPGLLHGGSGTALFLLHLYGLTEDEELLVGVERALQRDLAGLGLGPDGRRWNTTENSSVWTGTDGIVMVLHEAVKHLDVPWLQETHRSAAVATGRRLEHLPALFRARAGALMAYQTMHSESWTPSHERIALVRLHLGRLDLCGGRRHLHLTGEEVDERETGAAGHLLALAGLLGSGDRRVPFFW